MIFLKIIFTIFNKKKKFPKHDNWSLTNAILYSRRRAGYISFVRSYAAFPKDVRDVFNFQSLHLGHYAKSFALRDPPTRINSFGRAGKRDDKTSRFNTASQRNPSLKKRLAAR